MTRYLILLLLLACGIIARAQGAGLRAAVNFTDPTMKTATLIITNDLAQEVTLIKPYRAIYTHELTSTVKTAAGTVIPPHQTIFKTFGPPREEDIFHIPARTTQRLDIQVAPFHQLEHGRLYLVSMNYRTEQGQTLSLTFPYGLPAEKASPDEFISDWSLVSEQQVNRMQGRIRLVYDSLQTEGKKTARRFLLYLDLKNASGYGVAIGKQPVLTLQVTDGTGQPMPFPSELFIVSGNPIVAPRGLIPSSGMISYRMDASNAGIPVNGSVLVSTGYSENFPMGWSLQPGRYLVKATAMISTEAHTLTLDIPAVEIIVQPLPEK
ncbi:MAG: hypothetical protein ACYDCO_11455 [Armatimonadota bacterium]